MNRAISIWNMSCLALLATTGFARATEAAPNFVLILSDDQGWTGASAAMHPDRDDAQSDFFVTPNIERLANEGVRFSQGYAPASLCCPTRRSIQYGQTPARMGSESFAHRYRVGDSHWTIPRALRTVDPRYAAAHFGKWDLRAELRPEDLGYDESDGPTGNVDGNQASRFDKADKWTQYVETEDPKQIFSLSDRAVDFISRQVEAGRPFFVQISHYAVHADQQTRPASYARFAARPPGRRHKIPAYGGMTADLDAGVGEVLDALDRLQIADETFVIYLSDNGGVGWIPPNKRYHLANPADVPVAGRNDPLRGGKWTLFEGGLRVPFLVRGPGVQRGVFCRQPVVGWDLLPTIAELAGRRDALGDDLDGVSFASLLADPRGGSVSRSAPRLVFHRYARGYPHSAIRHGRYKLIKFWPTAETAGRRLLFDLDQDLGETTDLSQQRPDQADRLEQELVGYLNDVDAEFLAARSRHAPNDKRLAAGKRGATPMSAGRGRRVATPSKR